MTDFLEFHGSHTWLMWRAPVLRQVETFLREGKFARANAKDKASLLGSPSSKPESQ
jgi:hypothetical protein